MSAKKTLAALCMVAALGDLAEGCHNLAEYVRDQQVYSQRGSVHYPGFMDGAAAIFSVADTYIFDSVLDNAFEAKTRNIYQKNQTIVNFVGSIALLAFLSRKR